MILRVIPSVNLEKGGPINALINSTRLLLDRGFQIDIACLDGSDCLGESLSGLDVKLYSFDRKLGTYSLSISFFKWLDANVTNYNYVVIHGLWQFHSYAAASMCKKKNVPYFVFTHGMLDPWFNDNFLFKKIKKNIYWFLFERHVVNNAKYVLFTSEEEKVLARQSFFCYHPSERVIAYGSNKPDISFERAGDALSEFFPTLVGQKFILYFSRIHEKKGLDNLITAFATIYRNEDVRLVIAGSGDQTYVEHLKQLASKKEIQEKVLWIGMTTGVAKWACFYFAEAFVLPSHQENFGLVVSEALSASCPVLITNKVNIWREIERQNCGLVEGDDAESIIKLLHRWKLMRNDERVQLSKNALICYEKFFSIDASVNDLASIFSER